MVTTRLLLMSTFALSMPIFAMEEGTRKRPAQEELENGKKCQKIDKRQIIAENNLIQMLKDLRTEVDPDTGNVRNKQAFVDFVRLYKSLGLTLRDCVKTFIKQKKEKAYQAIQHEFQITDQEMQTILIGVKENIKQRNNKFNRANRVLVTNIQDEVIQDYIENKFFGSRISRHLRVEEYNRENFSYDDMSVASIYLNDEELKNFKPPLIKFTVEHELNHIKKQHTAHELFLYESFKYLLNSLQKQYEQLVETTFQIPLRSLNQELASPNVDENNNLLSTDMVSLIVKITHVWEKIQYWINGNLSSILMLKRAKETEADLLAALEGIEIIKGYIDRMAVVEKYIKEHNCEIDLDHPSIEKRKLWAQTILQLLNTEKELETTAS